MQEKNLTSTELAAILNVSKGLVSDIINYKKGLSKEVIRRLASYFKLSQEAFNRKYELQNRRNINLQLLR
jgi:HTH-type transcriptional regulator/antitoxin HigA